MSWRDDRDDALYLASILYIPAADIHEAHDAYGHTWSEILAKLEDNYEAYAEWIQYGGQDMMNPYPYDEDDWPDWAAFYHGKNGAE